MNYGELSATYRNRNDFNGVPSEHVRQLLTYLASDYLSRLDAVFSVSDPVIIFDHLESIAKVRFQSRGLNHEDILYTSMLTHYIKDRDVLAMRLAASTANRIIEHRMKFSGPLRAVSVRTINGIF